MRFYEFETKKVRHPHRPNLITLRYLNKEKHRHANALAAEEMRKPLLAAMYGQPVDDEALHQAKMKAIELEREKVELAKDKAELENIRAEQGEETFQQIKKLSRSAMRQRKKDK